MSFGDHSRDIMLRFLEEQDQRDEADTAAAPSNGNDDNARSNSEDNLDAQQQDEIQQGDNAEEEDAKEDNDAENDHVSTENPKSDSSGNRLLSNGVQRHHTLGSEQELGQQRPNIGRRRDRSASPENGDSARHVRTRSPLARSPNANSPSTSVSSAGELQPQQEADRQERTSIRLTQLGYIESERRRSQHQTQQQQQTQTEQQLQQQRQFQPQQQVQTQQAYGPNYWDNQLNKANGLGAPAHAAHIAPSPYAGQTANANATAGVGGQLIAQAPLAPASAPALAPAVVLAPAPAAGNGYQYVASTQPGPQVAAGAATRITNGRRRVQLLDGTWAETVRFSEIFGDNEQQNVTRRPDNHANWDADRHGNRPPILFLHTPTTQFLARQRQLSMEIGQRLNLQYHAWTDNRGRVIMNRTGRPIRFFPHLPETFSSEVEGWYLEALFRIDPVVRHSDIMDRMPDLTPTANLTRALHNRRARARREMRITNWQQAALVRRHADIFEQGIDEDMTAQDIRANSTRGLHDLTHREVAFLEDVAREPRYRPGMDTGPVLQDLRDLLTRVVATHGAGHRFATLLRNRIADWLLR